MQSLSIISDHRTGEEQALGATPSRMSDWLGVVASVGCAIHCAAMPFVISFLPTLGLSFLADESFHKVMVGVCALIAILAFVPGWRVHRKWLPAGIAMAGLTIIAAAAFALEDSCACCSPSETPEVAMVQQSEAGTCTDPSCEDCTSEAGEAAIVEQSDVSSCNDPSCELCAETSGTSVVQQQDSSLCADPNCELRAAETPAQMEACSEPPASPLLAGFTPWVTPLGGLLLVSAHLFNRRLTCRCGCCPTEATA